jgi:Na+-transporting methylmalonyl-CoA/oxaloacetate decarboxylase gamma subunit
MKPYGISVVIPVYFVLALLTRAMGRVLWNALAGKAWAQPVVIPMQQYAAMATAFMVAHLRIILQFLSVRMPLGIGKFFSAKQYITF